MSIKGHLIESIVEHLCSSRTFWESYANNICRCFGVWQYEIENPTPKASHFPRDFAWIMSAYASAGVYSPAQVRHSMGDFGVFEGREFS